jgi:hypothetical protein
MSSQLLSIMSDKHPMDFFQDVAGTFPQDSDVFKMMMEKYFCVSGDTFHEDIDKFCGDGTTQQWRFRLAANMKYTGMHLEMYIEKCVNLSKKTLPELYEMAQRWNVTLDDPEDRSDLKHLMERLNIPEIVPGKYTAEAYIEKKGGDVYKAQLIQKLAYHDDSHEEDQVLEETESSSSQPAQSTLDSHFPQHAERARHDRTFYVGYMRVSQLHSQCTTAKGWRPPFLSSTASVHRTKSTLLCVPIRKSTLLFAPMSKSTLLFDLVSLAVAGFLAGG